MTPNRIPMPATKMMQWAQANPNSMLGRMYLRRNPSASNIVQGSNNAAISPAPQINNQPAPPSAGFGLPYGISANYLSSQEPTLPVNIPSFEEGGLITEQGVAVRPNMPMPARGLSPGEPVLGVNEQQGLQPAQIEREAQKFVQSNPAEAQRIRAVMAQAVQSGALTGDELNMVIQLAKTALANPASYAQVREFAIQNGLGSQEDIPEEFDQGLLFVLVVIGKVLGSQVSGAAGQGVGQQVQAGALPSYKEGGHTGDAGHVAVLHSDEYVIPKDALLYHGKKTFDALIQKARESNAGQ